MVIKPNEIKVYSWSSKRQGGWSMAIPRGVELVHLPTGTVVNCEKHRSQHSNLAEAKKSLEVILAGQPKP